MSIYLSLSLFSLFVSPYLYYRNLPLRYRFSFGDGSTLSSSSPIVTHTYTTKGVFVAQLIVEDSQSTSNFIHIRSVYLYLSYSIYIYLTIPLSDTLGGVSEQLKITIQVSNAVPVPVIVFPTPSTQFRVGQNIPLLGYAFDAEEGNITST